MTRHLDAIIIGAGQAGPSLADRLTRAGMKVALVERKLFGGTCVNTGCTPTKTLVASAYAAHLARRSREYGVVLDGAVKIDMALVKARADAVSANSRVGVEKWLRGMCGCTVIQGHARFEGPDAIQVGEERLSAPLIYINVGGRAAVPDMPGIGEVSYLTNSSILGLDRVPEHLVVVGGSYIGLEFAQMYRRFGAEVTIVEKGPRLIAREDEDVSEAIRTILVEEGITVRTQAECIAFSPRPQGVAVSLDCTSGDPEVIGSHVLLAVGRRPNTEDLDLHRAGIATDARGYITVDEGLATSVPGIWALGDCNGRGAFTHTAYNDFEIVAANWLDGEQRQVSDRVPAYALYIDPPLGRVGMTVAQARATGRPLLIGTRQMTRVSRAIEKGETKGFMQVVVDAETHKILGAAILGTGGDEAIHGVLDMMNAGVSYATLQHAVPIHPTVSELIPTMLSEMRPAEVSQQTGSSRQDGREQQVSEGVPRRKIMNPSTERAVLAGGCFWGMQHLLRRYPGIVSTRVGYTGGDIRNATYRNHGTHAEALEIIFDPATISYREILEFFFQIHDPTTRNRQGNDVGASYRSAIFYTSDEQKRTAEDTIADVDASGLWPGKVVTEVAPAGEFWEAELEHQDYLERIPYGYNCHFVRQDWKLPVRESIASRDANVTA